MVWRHPAAVWLHLQHMTLLPRSASLLLPHPARSWPAVGHSSALALRLEAEQAEMCCAILQPHLQEAALVEVLTQAESGCRQSWRTSALQCCSHRRTTACASSWTRCGTCPAPWAGRLPCSPRPRSLLLRLCCRRHGELLACSAIWAVCVLLYSCCHLCC